MVLVSNPAYDGLQYMQAVWPRHAGGRLPAGDVIHADRHPAAPAQDSSRPAGSDLLELFAAAVVRAGDGDRFLVPVPLDLPVAAEAELAALLSEPERRRAARFRRPRDRLHYIVAHARLRQLLAERLGIGAGQVALGCNGHGKPELLGPQADSGWCFNLSYSDGAGGALALCALSSRGRIGVDVEAVRPLNDAGSIARHFFSAREYGLYRRLQPADRLLGFFHCWTRKEAFVKAQGTGLSHNLADFDVSLAPGAPARILGVGGKRGEGCGWRLESIGPCGGRVAAVVTEQKAS